MTLLQHAYCLLASLFRWPRARRALGPAHYRPLCQPRYVPAPRASPHGALLLPVLPSGSRMDGRVLCPVGRREQLAVPPLRHDCPDGVPPLRLARGGHPGRPLHPVGTLAFRAPARPPVEPHRSRLCPLGLPRRLLAHPARAPPRLRAPLCHDRASPRRQART
jgi:hypothetical protein